MALIYWLLIASQISGCAWWQAGVNDPEIVGKAIYTAGTYRKLGDATGIPYAGWTLASAALLWVVLSLGKKKAKNAPA